MTPAEAGFSDVQQLALYYFFMFAAFAALLAFVGLVYFYQRHERRERERIHHTKADIADIMILFQTMRDVIMQQKNLARDFNQELDRKMSLVKEVLAKSLEKNEKLYERQQELQKQLEEVKAELESVQRQTGYLRAAPATAPTQPQVRSAPTTSPAPAAPIAAQEATPLRVVPTGVPTPAPPLRRGEEERLAGTGLTDAPYSVWFGLDFDSTPEPEPEEEEEISPRATASEDPEAARGAFRALLNLPIPPASPPGTTAPAAQNGASAAVPLQQRVLEYSQAGMGISEIARELGIGKGEVRLMLSLAKQKNG